MWAQLSTPRAAGTDAPTAAPTARTHAPTSQPSAAPTSQPTTAVPTSQPPAALVRDSVPDGSVFHFARVPRQLPSRAAPSRLASDPLPFFSEVRRGAPSRAARAPG